MRCLLCATEMVVMHVVADNTMPVPGFERHTFQCPSCGDVEQRLIFNRGRQDETEPAQVAAPPVSPGPIPVNPETASSQSKDEKPAESPLSPTMPTENEPVTTVWAPEPAQVLAPPVSPGPIPVNPETASSQSKDEKPAESPLSPTMPTEDEPVTTVWARALAKLRGR